MPKFELEKINAIIGKQIFYKLLKDGICEFDEFVSQIKSEGNFDKEIKKVYALMQQVSELKTLPQEKFKELKYSKSDGKEYEIKTKHLRVYLFHQENTGKIIVIGGKKTTQDQDIAHFRETKKMYFEALKTK